jgi:hypothetical protein
MSAASVSAAPGSHATGCGSGGGGGEPPWRPRKPATLIGHYVVEGDLDDEDLLLKFFAAFLCYECI